MTARAIIHLRNDGAYSYDHAVDKDEADKGVGRSSGAMDSVDATDHGQPVLHQDEPSSRHALEIVLGNSGQEINPALDAAGGSSMVFNLFFDGEEPEEISDDPDASAEAKRRVLAGEAVIMPAAISSIDEAIAAGASAVAPSAINPAERDRIRAPLARLKLIGELAKIKDTGA